MQHELLVTVAVAALLVAGPAATTGSAQSTDLVTLTVSVEDPVGDPVGDAELTVEWENGSTTATTASNGKAFVDVPGGAEVAVSISHPEYVRNHPFVVRNASEQEVTVPVYRRGQVSVEVVDDDGGVADARVVLRKDGRIAAQEPTNESGVFTSGAVERGEYSVTVVKPGYLRNSTTVQVESATRTDVRIERGAVILTVAVRDSHFSPPRPVGNATVRVASVGQFQTLPEGQTSVSVPVNTVLSVTVTKDAYEETSERVRVGESDLRVNASAVRTPTLRLEPLNQRVVAGERVGVEVVDEYDEPVGDATILLDGDSADATGTDGRVSVPVDRPGEHSLVATKGDLRSEPVTVRAIAEDGETSTASATPTDDPTDTPTGTSSSTPGFTPVAAVLALAAVAGALALRRG